MDLQDLPAVAGVEHRDLTVNGVRLHVAQSGSGPALLLLHGWPQHWWAWRHLIPSLAAEHKVMVPDLRGWGWSDAPPGDYAKATFAADIAALIESEGVGPVQIIAHDWGAYTAFLLALERPELVERMVVLDIAPPWKLRPQPRHITLPLLLSYQVIVATPGLGPMTMTRGNGFIRGIIRTGSGRRKRWTEAELDAYAKVLRSPDRARASSACYRTFLTRELPVGRDRGYRPEQLSVPTLLAMGAASPLQRTLAPQPGPRLEVTRIDGAGHFLPEEAPEQVLTLAREFLGR